METFVKGKMPSGPQPAQELTSLLQSFGYEFDQAQGTFLKPGKIESVIIELVPIWENLGLDAQEMKLAEYNPNLKQPSAIYENGRIERAN